MTIWLANGYEQQPDPNFPNFRWRGACGERNYEISGKHHAYYQQGDVLKVHGAEHNMRDDDQQIVTSEQGILASAITIGVEVFRNNSWQPITVDRPTKDLVKPARFGCVCVEHAFPFAGLRPSDRPTLKTYYETGRRSRMTFKLEFSSPIAGLFRFRWKFRDAVGTLMSGYGAHRDRVYSYGVDFGDWNVRWHHHEGDERAVELARGGLDTHIIMGPYNLAAGEQLVVFPDTYGPNDPESDAADGNEGVDGSWQTNGWDAFGIIYLAGDSYDPGALHAGFSWTPNLGSGASISSINAGTQLDMINPGCNSSPASLSFDAFCVDAATPAVFSGSNLPSAATATTGSADNTTTCGTGNYSVDMQAPINELCVTDGNTYSGTERIAIMLRQPTQATGGPWASLCDDTGGTNPADLTIEYTPATGGPALAQGLHEPGRGINPQRVARLGGQLQ